MVVLLLKLAVMPVRRLTVLLLTSYQGLLRLGQPMAVEGYLRHGGISQGGDRPADPHSPYVQAVLQQLSATADETPPRPQPNRRF